MKTNPPLAELLPSGPDHNTTEDERIEAPKMTDIAPDFNPFDEIMQVEPVETSVTPATPAETKIAAEIPSLDERLVNYAAKMRVNGAASPEAMRKMFSEKVSEKAAAKLDGQWEAIFSQSESALDAMLEKELGKSNASESSKKEIKQRIKKEDFDGMRAHISGKIRERVADGDSLEDLRPFVQQLMQTLVHQGYDTPETLLSQLQKELQKFFPDITADKTKELIGWKRSKTEANVPTGRYFTDEELHRIYITREQYALDMEVKNLECRRLEAQLETLKEELIKANERAMRPADAALLAKIRDKLKPRMESIRDDLRTRLENKGLM